MSAEWARRTVVLRRRRLVAEANELVERHVPRACILIKELRTMGKLETFRSNFCWVRPTFPHKPANMPDKKNGCTTYSTRTLRVDARKTWSNIYLPNIQNAWYLQNTSCSYRWWILPARKTGGGHHGQLQLFPQALEHQAVGAHPVLRKEWYDSFWLTAPTALQFHRKLCFGHGETH